jgi:exodeoxyribonuclease-3
MRIATFNVNGINSRLPALLQWLEETQPDVACLQELKAPQERFPEMRRSAPPATTRSGMARRAGTAWRSWRAADPTRPGAACPAIPDDLQSRYIEAGQRRDRRLPLSAERQSRAGAEVRLQAALVRALRRSRRGLMAHDIPVVLAGDYNVMPTELDVYKPERWLTTRCFGPRCAPPTIAPRRPGLDRRLRSLHPGERIYTFWDYFRNAYARDAGLRIDHLLLSPKLAPRLKAAGVDRQVRGWDKPSDHAPTWVELDWTKLA